MPQPLAWAMIAVLCAAIVVWGYAYFFMVRDVPRQWSYPVLPDTPGQSAYSTAGEPTSQPAPAQLPPLPEKTPIQPVGGQP